MAKPGLETGSMNNKNLPEEALCISLVAPRDIAGAGFEPATFGL